MFRLLAFVSLPFHASLVLCHLYVMEIVVPESIFHFSVSFPHVRVIFEVKSVIFSQMPRHPSTRRTAAQSLWSETVDCDDNRTGSLYVSRARISFERNRYMLLNGIKLSVGFPPRRFVHSRLNSVQVTSDLYLIRGTIFLIISLIM